MVSFKNLTDNVKVDRSSSSQFNEKCSLHNRGYKYQCYKVERSKGINADVNNIEFYCYDDGEYSVVIVSDKDCQLERTYCVGQIRWLGDFNDNDEEFKEMIESQEQIINAWATGKIWF